MRVNQHLRVSPPCFSIKSFDRVDYMATTYPAGMTTTITTAMTTLPTEPTVADDTGSTVDSTPEVIPSDNS
jgi:hypothetical protein